MNKVTILLLALVIFSCREKREPVLTAQNIIDKSIEVCGGSMYRSSAISFDFRDKTYVLENSDGQRVMKRIFKIDSTVVIDVLKTKGFQRFVNNRPINLADSIAEKYTNSVNSVHYFAYLPYGLNDPAVNKESMGKVKIKGKEYFKIKITFDEKGGGEDFEDTYIYWFDTTTFKPDYLAYEFHDDGGGMRFREAYNERYVHGIRFVDYRNYQPKDADGSIFKIDSLFIAKKLELLSKIELRNISVRPDSYN